jgi:hypothetical protein
MPVKASTRSTAEDNKTSPSKPEWKPFLIVDHSLRPEGFHLLTSEGYNVANLYNPNGTLSLSQLLARATAYERYGQDTTYAYGDADHERHEQSGAGFREAAEDDRRCDEAKHRFLHVDHSLRPEGLHFVAEGGGLQLDKTGKRT